MENIMDIFHVFRRELFFPQKFVVHPLNHGCGHLGWHRYRG
jgi:hypothetical protein